MVTLAEGGRVLFGWGWFLLAPRRLEGAGKGITTDGTNIWVVDIKDDLAYKYTMSGTFLSSFALNALNGNASGITTDGINIWVVDRFGNKEVFKYDLFGAFIFTFPLTGLNSNPFGITVSHK